MDPLFQHPGGAYVMEDYLGFDATLAFRSVGHSTDALTMLDNYLIGILNFLLIQSLLLFMSHGKMK